ncbi:2-polyprenyl-6-methoxyphenol hydroxylase-like FAD-dependent oxidoreductase [Microbacterium testaceum]|uniref:FAD-dependent monooxygenase n=1 Tax=Microbacterium TaxID=33882 RepID=UPI00226FA870|nr:MULTISPECIES: FAD-dependent monooxygenase [Microbacterium]MDQ1113577.1 2-polyprenyl-6-methoxyphenol hydroxylase-like FAD-dependent oxidoreductase [Microbacterium testaceum]WAC69046.1 FAD-dependent monooxygenase [Microbacterium sp. SL75]
MRIAIIGGGPGGLLFAALAARNIPGAHVDLFERNRADEAFGFGVVFSNATQSGVDAADSALRETLDASGVRWDAIRVTAKGETMTFAGNGMGAVLRKDLLAALQQRAVAAGAHLHFSAPRCIDELGDYDVIVAADGANSQTRAAIGDDTLGVTYETAAAKFIWFATDAPFEGLTFLHTHAEGLPDDVAGVFAAHAYPIGGGLSTFIVETDEDTWRAAGLDAFAPTTPPGPSDEHSQHRLEQIFAPLIGGARLIGNNSRWGNFRTIRARSWHRGNVALLGDAVHTAHFSVGSGTKMSLEDAIALADALAAHPDDVEAAFLAYEGVRQPQVARIQGAARPSLSWWENFGTYFHAFEPWQFGFHFFSRALPAAKIARRDPDAVDRALRQWQNRHGAPPLESAVTGLLDRRVLDRDQLPPVVTVAAGDGIRPDDAVREALAGHADASAVLVTGGSALDRQLTAEAARLRHGVAAIIDEPECDEDRAMTLVLSGRADAVLR